MRRSEAEWFPDQPVITVGSAEAGHVDSDHAAAVLWVPDPEQRRGWREVYVSKPGAKPDRPFGFRKPR